MCIPSRPLPDNETTTFVAAFPWTATSLLWAHSLVPRKRTCVLQGLMNLQALRSPHLRNATARNSPPCEKATDTRSPGDTAGALKRPEVTANPDSHHMPTNAG